MDSRQKMGRLGEDFSAWLLEGLGYRIVTRNWRSRYGEIDVVATSPNGTLCFVEVRTTNTQNLGGAWESLTPRKRSRLARQALVYLSDSNWKGPARIDFMAHENGPMGWETKFLENAFGKGGR